MKKKIKEAQLLNWQLQFSSVIQMLRVLITNLDRVTKLDRREIYFCDIVEVKVLRLMVIE